MSRIEPQGAHRLILLRHGQTIWNAEGRFQGQTDTPLDEHGIAQAAAAAAVLAKEPVSRVVASDLSRARLTGQALADVLGLELEVDPRLQEMHMGSWDGLIPHSFAEFRAAEHPDDLRRSETGEHVRETADRVAAALLDHVASTPDGGLLVVATHGIAARVAMCRLLDIPFPLWRTFGALGNCCWIDLGYHRGAWRIDGYNRSA